MKKISKGYRIAAALLTIWAVVDFYNYVTVGKGLAVYYSGENIVLELIQNSLIRGTAKVLLAVIIIIVGFIRARKNAPIKSFFAVTGLLVFALAAVWGAGMFCLTSVTAEYAAARYLDRYSDYASVIASRSIERWFGKGLDSRYENYDINCLWQAADDGGCADVFRRADSTVGGDSGFMGRPDSDKVYSAAAIYDAKGNMLECSWKDYFYFEYLTEEQWQNRDERSGNNARAFFNRKMLTEKGKEMIGDSDLKSDAAAIRFTGFFDGVEFTPSKIEYIDWHEFRNALYSKGRSGQYTVPGVVEDSGLRWNVMYEDVSDGLSPGKTVTLYSDWFDVCYNQSSPAFSYKGEDHEHVASLVAQLGPELSAGTKALAFYSGLDLLIPSVNYCQKIGGDVYYDPNYYGEAAYADEAPQVCFYTVSAVYCSPWRTAFEELKFIYLITFLFAAALAVAVSCVILRHLIRPVQAVGNAMTDAEKRYSLHPERSSDWYESRLLQIGFSEYNDKIRMQKNEITRLNTALQYAKTAEENRRQMTSNIAHELKTPLAVIHSYAEGLKEHIAEDKREKYLDTILSEAERTDGMVLEMLDLSRLEAGRVKLSRDKFSLIELTRNIFEKLEISAREKNLRIGFILPDDFTVTADESRLAQAIENLATNAIKYTPDGGCLSVTIRKDPLGATLGIENESEPLSPEELGKVWDTFYRGDKVRSGGGTGLGLAIVKNIIELHGGTCFARNTEGGVGFGFTLPDR